MWALHAGATVVPLHGALGRDSGRQAIDDDAPAEAFTLRILQTFLKRLAERQRSSKPSSAPTSLP